MRKAPLQIIALIAASPLAMAQSTYQVDAGFRYVDLDVDGRGFSENGDAWQIYGQYYIDPVSTEQGPYAENGFLSKKTSVYAGYTNIDYLGDDDVLEAGARLVFNEQYIGALSLFQGDDIDGFSLEGGMYLTPSSTVTLYYEDADLDNLDTDRIEVRYRAVFEQTNALDFAIDASFGQIDIGNDDGFGISAGGTIYPSKQLGVGASFEYADLDDSYDNLSLFAEYFINKQFAVFADYSTGEERNIDIDAFSIGVRGRF